MNRVAIDGEITAIEPLRHTPAGVPIAEATLLHHSKQTVAGVERALTCELAVQASGDLAKRLAACLPGTRLRITGALNRRSVRSAKLILILNEMEKE